MDLAKIDSKTPVQLQRRGPTFPNKFIADVSNGVEKKMNIPWKLLSANLLFFRWEHFCIFI